MKSANDSTVHVPPPSPIHLQMDAVATSPLADNNHCYKTPLTNRPPPIFSPTNISSPFTLSPSTHINVSTDINTGTKSKIGQSPYNSPCYHSSHFLAGTGQSCIQPISEQQVNNNSTYSFCTWKKVVRWVWHPKIKNFKSNSKTVVCYHCNWWSSLSWHSNQ